MRILGDEASTQFRTLAQELGVVCAHHDVLVGREERTISIGDSQETILVCRSDRDLILSANMA